MLTNMFMRALVLQMQARGIERPLLQYVRVAELWRDLCPLSGAIVPDDVAEACRQPPFTGLEPES